MYVIFCGEDPQKKIKFLKFEADLHGSANPVTNKKVLYALIKPNLIRLYFGKFIKIIIRVQINHNKATKKFKFNQIFWFENEYMI